MAEECEDKIQRLAGELIEGLSLNVDTPGAVIFRRFFTKAWARRGLELSLRFHSETPDIPLGAYIYSRVRDLAAEASKKVVLYLDINHWIRLRDVILGRSTQDPRYGAILNQLQLLRSRGEVICPLSFDLFAEVVKQTDDESRQATSDLMDLLSGGMCLHNPLGVVNAEFAEQIRRSVFGDRPESTALQGLVWTKIGIATAHMFHLSDPDFLSGNLVLQKALFDCYWNLPLETITEDVSRLDCTSRNQTYANATNEDARWFRERRISFERTLELEKARIFKSWMGEFEAMAKQFYEHHMSACTEATQKEEFGGYDPTVLPSIQVLASVNAALIVGTKKFKQNDIFDFNHASVAVPYCDAMACDRPMATLMKSKPLNMDQSYGLRIFSEPEELLAFVTCPRKKQRKGILPSCFGTE